jgi:uncharacterized PurR-regulated membrane protein YhhQ (DUF165 family)
MLAFVLLPGLFGATPINLADAAFRVISGQTIIKLSTVLLMTPLIYLIPENMKIKELSK